MVIPLYDPICEPVGERWIDPLPAPLSVNVAKEGSPETLTNVTTFPGSSVAVIFISAVLPLLIYISLAVITGARFGVVTLTSQELDPPLEFTARTR